MQKVVDEELQKPPVWRLLLGTLSDGALIVISLSGFGFYNNLLAC